MPKDAGTVCHVNSQFVLVIVNHFQHVLFHLFQIACLVRKRGSALCYCARVHALYTRCLHPTFYSTFP